MHKCENDSLKIEGSRLKIFDGYYSDWDIYPIKYCPLCGINLQPERLNPEDKNWFGMKAEIKDGLCYFEDGTVVDLSQPIDVSDSPTPENK